MADAKPAGPRVPPEEKTTRRIRGNTGATAQAAWQLRRELTPAEEWLWEALRKKGLNEHRFRLQHPVGRFVLDFYCPRYKLVVEVDGSAHDGEEERDAARTAHLAAYGYRVIRFTNDDIFHDLPSVLVRIKDAAYDQAPGPTDQPSALAPPILGDGGPKRRSPENVS